MVNSLIWNCEKSSEFFEDTPLVRYHFVFRGNRKFRKTGFDNITSQMQRVLGTINVVKDLEEEPDKDGGFYRFCSLDCLLKPSDLDLTKLPKCDRKKDIYLIERKQHRRSVEDYVASKYRR